MFTTTELTTCTCYKCGIVFAAPAHFFDTRHKDHVSFYCPNGHSQHFSGQTKEERRIAELEREVASKNRRLYDEERSRKCAERKAKKLAKAKEQAEARAAVGTCPCCHRNFKQLRRHMKSKHPKFVEEAKTKRCQKRK